MKKKKKKKFGLDYHHTINRKSFYTIEAVRIIKPTGDYNEGNYKANNICIGNITKTANEADNQMRKKWERK